MHKPVRRSCWLWGHYDWLKENEALRSEVIIVGKDAFTNDPAIAAHSAARWLLRRLGESAWVDEELNRLAGLKPHPKKDWYVNTEGHTMAIIDGRDVPDIGYVYEIATTEVTVDQILRFRPDHAYYEYRSPTTDCPTGLCTWYDTTAYCRWLTSQVEPVDAQDLYPEFKEPFPVPDSETLRRVVEGGAYRLPTSAEWTYASKTITSSRRYFGYGESVLDDWVWRWETSVDENGDKIRYWPADTKHPNQSGLFALYDGVREWGHDASENRFGIFGQASSVSSPVLVQSKLISYDLPAARNGYYGFRVARTVVAD